jgi:hypothetical protein
MKASLIALSLLLSLSAGLHAQFYFTPVSSDLSDESLLTELRATYKTSTVLDDSGVKDTLMAVIYYDRDLEQVSCVYTQHVKPLSPNSDDPNQEVFDNGASSGLNVEHIYPRAKGASIGIANSDMHHLAPAKVNVNADRGNLPFGENNDNQTDRWYWQSSQRTSRPTTNIDQYSEWLTNSAFEPREDFKGNVARAVMYFYTMYTAQADNADPTFFSSQIDMLCDWHYADPVDSAEWHRTWLIADYQEGKPNPFVLDCSVAARSYCPEIDATCQQTVDVEETAVVSALMISPNPSDGLITIAGLTADDPIVVFNAYGAEVLRTTATQHSTSLDLREQEAGLFFVVTPAGSQQVVLIH